MVDLLENGSYECKFNSHRNRILNNEAKFSINAQELDLALEDLEHHGPPEDEWDVIGPNARHVEADALEEGFRIERNIPVADRQVNVDLDNYVDRTIGNENLYTKEADKALISAELHDEMMESLNEQQSSFIRHQIDWCGKAVDALKEHKCCPQNLIFLSGPGGVGKSHIIKLVHYETMVRLRQLSEFYEPSEVPVLLTAPTSTAAFGIRGITLHSAFCLSNDSKDSYRSLSSSKLNTLRASLSKLKLLIIDEISMVGADTLHIIHRRLEEITGETDLPFGGVSILAVGDLYQLPPVMAKFIFKDPSNCYAQFYGSLWRHHFQVFELTEPMRHKSDTSFSNLLLRIRTNTQTDADILKLKERIISTLDHNYPSDALHKCRSR